jgi:CysZ protein
MIAAAVKAMGDVLSPDFRSVLFKALGLTIALFIAVLIGVETILIGMTRFSSPWADWVLGIGTGLALFVAFFFLIFPVTAAFAGLFLDTIAEKVENRHYPRDRPGKPLPAIKGIVMAIHFFVVVLLVNLAVLPLVPFGIGVIALVIANAYLLSREYFEMAAMRHMPLDEARELRKTNGPAIFVAGLLPALLSFVPFANLVVPLFATSYFVHLFKSVQASSA